MTEQARQLHTEDLAGRRTRVPGDIADREAVFPPPSAEQAIDQPDVADGGWAAVLGDTTEFASRWDAIQAGFVEEPRRAVEEADALVARVIQRVADSFSVERSRLEAQWSRGDQVGTEDLRVALIRYRSFFNQLLMRSDSKS